MSDRSCRAEWETKVKLPCVFVGGDMNKITVKRDPRNVGNISPVMVDVLVKVVNRLSSPVLDEPGRSKLYWVIDGIRDLHGVVNSDKEALITSVFKCYDVELVWEG